MGFFKMMSHTANSLALNGFCLMVRPSALSGVGFICREQPV